MSEILVNTIKKADGTGSLTVPADTGTVLTTATAASSIPGYGNQISTIDTYRLITDVSMGSGGVITTNWERPDARGHYVGSGVTESSGIFSFSETGIYFITYFIFAFIQSSAGNTRNTNVFLQSTLDNSTYDHLSFSNISKWNHSDNTHIQHNGHAIFDVTDTANRKVRLNTTFGNGYGYVSGNTDYNRSAISFIRLGDT